VFDREDTGVARGVLIRARRQNRLYPMERELFAPIGLVTKIEEEAWKWHARFGHLNFRVLHDLGARDMVDGLPLIKKVEQVCDGCALGKLHCAPFPQSSVACKRRIRACSHRFVWIDCTTNSKRQVLFYVNC
jgi:hypothetical protein